MKVLITGWSGTIGKYLIPLLAQDNEMFLVSRTFSQIESVKNVTLFLSDYSRTSLHTLMKGCDAVVHLAAERSAKHWLENVTLDALVFSTAQEANIQNVVFVSTRGIYGLDSMHADESSIPQPIDDYAFGKLCSENIALRLNEGGMRIKCLRLAQVMSLTESKKNIMTSFLRAGTTGEPIRLFKGANIFREYIYVKDVAQGIKLALLNFDANGLFNLGSGWAHTLGEYAEMISCISPRRPEIILIDSELTHERSLMKIEKFQSTFLDFEPKSCIDALNDIYYGKHEY